MRWKNRLIFSALASLIYLVLSFFSNIVPCKLAPAVPNPIYLWNTCSLNPDISLVLGGNKLYFGFTSSITDAYIISILGVFFIFMILFSIRFPFTHKSRKEDK